MKPSSGKQDKLQLGDTDDSGSCLNESCLQPSRGIMFLQSLAYPDWPLNSIQLHLASAKTAEHTHLGNPAPHPENQLQASTDLQWALGTGQGRAGRSLCRVAWLCLGKLLGGKRNRKQGLGVGGVPRYFTTSTFGPRPPGRGILCQWGKESITWGLPSREAAAGRSRRAVSWSLKAGKPFQTSTSLPFYRSGCEPKPSPLT